MSYGAKCNVKKSRKKTFLFLINTVGILAGVCFTVICFYLHCVKLWIK